VRDLPVHRTITSSDGKSLKVRVVGKQANTLIVERVSDNVRFEIPLERLSEADKRFFNRLRNEVTSDESDYVTKESDYVTKRTALILELRERAELYRKEIASQTLSRNLHEKRILDLESVEKEIRTLEMSIENFKFRNRSN
jgi:rRNA maturation endonuclease Nob1